MYSFEVFLVILMEFHSFAGLVSAKRHTLAKTKKHVIINVHAPIHSSWCGENNLINANITTGGNMVELCFSANCHVINNFFLHENFLYSAWSSPSVHTCMQSCPQVKIHLRKNPEKIRDNLSTVQCMCI